MYYFRVDCIYTIQALDKHGTHVNARPDDRTERNTSNLDYYYLAS